MNRRLPEACRFVPFEPRHLGRLRLQRAQSDAQPFLAAPDLYGPIIDHDEMAFSLLRKGNPIACFGVLPWSAWRGHAWALIGEGFGAVREWAIPRINDGLDRLQRRGMHRLEATVQWEFRYARRFVQRLGFEEEGTMKAYGHDRQNYVLFSRIRP